MKRSFLTAALSLLLLGGRAMGQEPEARRVLFTLDANPSGPTIALEGTERILGATPLLIPAPLTGAYQLGVIEPGFERSRGEVVFAAREGRVTLERFDQGLAGKRALRSVFLPGLGQLSAGESTRGWSFFSAALALGIGTLIAEKDFLDARDDVRSLASAPSGLSQEEGDARTIARLTAERDQNSAYRLRNALGGATAAVWGLSVLDAAFFVPSFEARLIKPDLLTIRAHRKTSAGRAIRSALLPGLGQFYGGSRTRGLVYLGAGSVAAAIAVSAHLAYKDDNEEATFLLERLRIEERGGDIVAAEKTRGEFRGSLGDRDDDYDLRNQAMAAAGAVWVLSVVDALLFEEPSIKRGRADVDTRRGESPCIAWRFDPAEARIGLLLRY